MSDATQTGANEVEKAVEQEIQPTSNPRNDAIAELAKARAEQLDAESKEGEIYRDPEQEAALAPDAEPQAEPSAESKVRKLKVDGHEIEVPEDKIIEAGVRTLQKEAAADARLNEASRILREMQQRAAMFAQQQASASQPNVEPPPEKDAADIARALQLGTEQEAVEAVNRLRAQQSLTPDALAAKVAETLEARAVRQRILGEFQTAANRFRTEYKDILDDPNLAALALAKEEQVFKSGDNRHPWERYSQIGNEVREWRDKMKASGFDQKREAKAAAASAVTPAAGRKAAPPQDQPKTTEQIIENMRRARHQL